jgi:hypothetical protein
MTEACTQGVDTGFVARLCQGRTTRDRPGHHRAAANLLYGAQANRARPARLAGCELDLLCCHATRGEGP